VGAKWGSDFLDITRFLPTDGNGIASGKAKKEVISMTSGFLITFLWASI
jgi:hypothetical protein